MGNDIHRRKVLGLLGCGAAAAAVGGYKLLRPGAGVAHASPASPGWTAGEGVVQAAAGQAALTVARNGEPRALVDAAIAGLGGMARFVSSGDRVLVKPNMGWDRKPELAANTNPEIIARLVELALEAGAKKVTVLDRTCNDARRCYANSGIEAAASAAGARVVHVDDERVTRVDLGGDVLHEWDVYDEIADVDVRINVPIAKHHALSQLSLGMKNLMGCIGGNRSRMHQQIHRSVVDLAAYFRPQLTVLDAYRILTANGPTGGNPADVTKLRVLCASADPVAVDTFGASLFGIGSDTLRSLEIGEQRGLGTRDLSSLATLETDLGG